MLSYSILLDRYTKLQKEHEPTKKRLWYYKTRCEELETKLSSLQLEKDKLEKEVRGLAYLTGEVLAEREEYLKCINQKKSDK